MIKGFEDITVEINENERHIADIIVKRFESRKGKHNIVTCEQIVIGLKNKFNIEIRDVRVRKIIQFIRVNNIVTGLIASSKGYFVAESIDEMNEWIDSLVSRENAIRQIREMAERHVEQLKSKNVQQSLF